MDSEITIKRRGTDEDWGVWCADGFATFRAFQDDAVDLAIEHNERSHRGEYRIAIEVKAGKQ